LFGDYAALKPNVPNVPPASGISLCRHHRQRTLLLFTCHSTKAHKALGPALTFRWKAIVWQQICCSCGFGELSLTCGIRRPP